MIDEQLLKYCEGRLAIIRALGPGLMSPVVEMSGPDIRRVGVAFFEGSNSTENDQTVGDAGFSSAG